MRPKLVPELDVADLARALRFYTEVCGFRVDYERREEIEVAVVADEDGYLLRFFTDRP